ncbi:MAG TPA: hypothetical protein VMF69_04900 [Gemmataceae bacterium]|nr:hypothetical protein [Gemmataceae bacterium]
MPKRKTAEAQDSTPTDDEIVNLTEQPPAANPAAESASQAAAPVEQGPPASQDNAPPSGADGRDHAAREPGDDTQKSWVKKANVIADPEAGMKFAFDYEKHQAIITFDEKPTPELLAVARPILNEGGFHWHRENEGWTKPIRFTTREDDRREAKKTFYAVANALREQKGLPARSFGEVMAF